MFRQVVFVLSFFALLSCSHTESVANSQAFYAPKDKVWEVLVAVFKAYPLKTIDDQTGYIETQTLKATRFWKAPHQKNQDFSGYSSVITVRLSYTKPFARVFIDKKVYRQKGFISSKEEIPSDSLEEAVLLYKIARELEVRSRFSQIQP